MSYRTARIDRARAKADCPCGRVPDGGRTGQGIISHTLKTFGQPPRLACMTCADEAPLGTLVRRIVDTEKEPNE